MNLPPSAKQETAPERLAAHIDYHQALLQMRSGGGILITIYLLGPLHLSGTQLRPFCLLITLKYK